MIKRKTPQQIQNEAEREAKKLIRDELKTSNVKTPKAPKPKNIKISTPLDKPKSDKKSTKKAKTAKATKPKKPKTYKDVKTLTKLEKNAQEIKFRKQRALSFITELENQGYIVPEKLKEIASSTTADRATEKTLSKFKGRTSPTSLDYISKHSYLSTDIVYGGGSDYAIDPTATRLTHYDIEHGKAHKAINKGLQQKITYKNKDGEEVSRHIRSDRESMFLLAYIKTATGKDFADLYAGYEDEHIKISKSWDKSRLSLAENVTLKKTSTDPMAIEQLRRLSSMAYSSYKLYNEYQEAAGYSKFMNYVNNVNDKHGNEPGVSDYAMEMLSHILNTSHAWNIARQSAPDSDQTKENYEELLYMGSKTQSLGTPDLIAEFIRMIENEEPLVNIEMWFDNNIANITGS